MPQMHGIITSCTLMGWARDRYRTLFPNSHCALTPTLHVAHIMFDQVMTMLPGCITWFMYPPIAPLLPREGLLSSSTSNNLLSHLILQQYLHRSTTSHFVECSPSPHSLQQPSSTPGYSLPISLSPFHTSQPH